MLARDIMNKKMVIASPEMTLRELAKLFIDKKITGAPVIDKWSLVGVVSQTDIVRRDREKPEPTEVPGYYREGDHGLLSGGYHIEEPDQTRVVDVMTPVVMSAEETTPVEELAQIMLDKHIHRIVITRGGKLYGIVTTMDMLRALLEKVNGRKPAPQR